MESYYSFPSTLLQLLFWNTQQFVSIVETVWIQFVAMVTTMYVLILFPIPVLFNFFPLSCFSQQKIYLDEVKYIC
jgi:hypothetical protein